MREEPSEEVRVEEVDGQKEIIRLVFLLLESGASLDNHDETTEQNGAETAETIDAFGSIIEKLAERAKDQVTTVKLDQENSKQREYLSCCSQSRANMVENILYDIIQSEHPEYLPNAIPILILLCGKRETKENVMDQVLGMAVIDPKVFSELSLRPVNLNIPDSPAEIVVEDDAAAEKISGMSQRSIRDCLLRASNPLCSDSEARRILQCLAVAARTDVDYDHTDSKFKASHDLNQTLVDNLFQQIYKLDRSKLSALYPIFAMLCARRSIKFSIADIDWNFIEQTSKDKAIVIESNLETKKRTVQEHVQKASELVDAFQKIERDALPGKREAIINRFYAILNAISSFMPDASKEMFVNVFEACLLDGSKDDMLVCLPFFEECLQGKVNGENIPYALRTKLNLHDKLPGLLEVE